MGMHDVMDEAAYRHRWVLAYRKLCDLAGTRLPFEPVRVASAESYGHADELTDLEIVERVRELTNPIGQYTLAYTAYRSGAENEWTVWDHVADKEVVAKVPQAEAERLLEELDTRYWKLVDDREQEAGR